MGFVRASGQRTDDATCNLGAPRMNKSEAKSVMREFASNLVTDPDLTADDRTRTYQALAICLVFERDVNLVFQSAMSIEREQYI